MEIHLYFQFVSYKVCETCGVIVKAVSYDGHVKMHLRAKAGDNGEDDVASLYCFCDRCGKRFTTQNGLTHHIKVTDCAE